MSTEQQQSDPLALDGGPRAVTLATVDWPPALAEITETIERALADGSWGQYHAIWIDTLCDRLGSFLGTKNVWPCSSGTIAVELGLRGLGVGPDDEVILAAYDFPGNFRAIESTGAKPVLVDLQENSWRINWREVEQAVSSATKAIIVSHLHGELSEM